jgi:hypothetical protein
MLFVQNHGAQKNLKPHLNLNHYQQFRHFSNPTVSLYLVEHTGVFGFLYFYEPVYLLTGVYIQWLNDLSDFLLSYDLVVRPSFFDLTPLITRMSIAAICSKRLANR